MCLGLAAWLALSVPAEAFTASRLSILGIYEDMFWNYDFLDNQGWNNTHTDWPITMLFYGNADVAKVKNIYWGDTNFASVMYGSVSDDGWTFMWIPDDGTKDWGLVPCSTNPTLHMRVYGRLYNIGWGYYVLGTTHNDINECLPPYQMYGWSENTENEFGLIAQSKGYPVYSNWGWFNNPEPDRWETNHFWQSNGYATAVYVP
ncbi:MAG: hypothetical protein KGJ80_13805 [Chloroflexota bacterium]|nr:hypothetical protein [Chloroflexota bacterium]